MNAKQDAKWTWITDDPPTVFFEGELWLVCPHGGFDCARVPKSRPSRQMAEDTMSVHVSVSHERWS